MHQIDFINPLLLPRPQGIQGMPQACPKKRPTSNPHVLGPSETGEASIRDCEVLVF
jgi:hypothetical protein